MPPKQRKKGEKKEDKAKIAEEAFMEKAKELLFQPKSTQFEVEKLQATCLDYEKRIASLNELINRERKVQAEVSESMLERLENKEKEAFNLRKKIDSIHEQQEKRIVSVNFEKDKIIRAKDKEIAETKEQLNDLLNELHALTGFRKNREEYQQHLQELVDSKQDVEKYWKERYERLNTATIRQQTILEKKHEKRLEEALQEAELNRRNIRQENEDQLRLQAIESLRKERNSLQKINSQLQEQNEKLTLALNRHSTAKSLDSALNNEAVKRSQRQAVQIRDLVRKVSSLQVELTEKAKTYQNTIAEQKNRFLGLLEEQSFEIEALKKLIIMKNGKLRKLKTLSRYILSQRTDLENFLLSSIALVTKEVQNNNIKGWDWEEREKVLKVLFNRLKDVYHEEQNDNLMVHSSFGSKTSSIQEDKQIDHDNFGISTPYIDGITLTDLNDEEFVDNPVDDINVPNGLSTIVADDENSVGNRLKASSMLPDLL
eukprot:TRINITY_DN1713_c0_g1_i1.p1 TRINITY_DN1713_c0_g1~~TRINITY_DN1713_c0_g1_i1.p1  ORF type:complete len:486 (-),score=174.22 TRINITY_DN1713_c0_g1_i1:47-1504(-)